MIALNDACMAITKGDCKAAIVGGTSLHLSPATVTSLSEAGVFSPDGSSKTFSANANGFARGEGIVAIYVKSLDDAIRDGNAIRAVISGISTNFDGKTATMGRPYAPTQEANIRRAYEVAGISDIWRTGLFECHGTGTAAGDPVEAEALAAVFGGKGIHISSLKPNLGHSEGAAGVSGVWGFFPPLIPSFKTFIRIKQITTIGRSNSVPCYPLILGV
jgi:acyl transferase domain-containing protein